MAVFGPRANLFMNAAIIGVTGAGVSWGGVQ